MFARKNWAVVAALGVLALIAAACAAPTAPPPVVQTVVVPQVQTVVAPQTVVVPVQQTVVTQQTVVVQQTTVPVVVTATPAPTKPVPTGLPKTINVAATWGGSERDAFLAVIDAFTAKTGIQVNYESMRNNEGAILRTRVAAGNPPDIALEPRPGEVAEFARSGNLINLSFMQADLAKAFNQGYLDVGNVDGKQVGFVWKANSKSTFWYRAADFKASGWTMPKNLTEFTALADKLVAAGKVPLATDGSSASAWVLSDYLENTAIRRMTAQQYNDLYVTHKMAWTDPAAKQALADFALFFKPGYQLGGTSGVLAGTFPNMIAQVFGPTPKAEMLYEGGFVSVLVQDVNKTIKPIDEMDFTIFPQGDPQYGDPVMGGGDVAIMFKDSPEGRQFLQYIISPEAANVFAATNTISPNKLIDTTKFTNPLALKEYQQLANAKTFVFDGSDLAPSAFGGDHLFTELQKLVQNPTTVDAIATELESFAKNDYK
jgi:alpha-glucoside transport system substrate-binding protein